jgi:hypothetical protein
MNTHDGPLRYAHKRYQGIIDMNDRRPVDLDAHQPIDLDAHRPERASSPEADVYRTINVLNDSLMAELEQRLKEPETAPLDAIAALVGSLTYGEMVLLAEQLWNCRLTTLSMTETPLTADNLAPTLHRWATTGREAAKP